MSECKDQTCLLGGLGLTVGIVAFLFAVMIGCEVRNDLRPLGPRVMALESYTGIRPCHVGGCDVPEKHTHQRSTEAR